MSSKHRLVARIVADLTKELGIHSLHDSVKAITQRASYLENQGSILEQQLKKCKSKLSFEKESVLIYKTANKIMRQASSFDGVEIITGLRILIEVIEE